MQVLKKLSVVLLFFGISQGVLFGERYVNYEAKDGSSPRIEDIAEKNAFGSWQGKSTSASLKEGFTADAAFIYWQAKEDDLPFAIALMPTAIEQAEFLFKSEEKQLDFAWKPGVQVNLGYILPQKDQWKLNLMWTYVHSNADAHAKTNDPEFHFTLKPLANPYILGTQADEGKANWQNNFNTIDASLGRSFFLGKWLSLNPYVGLRTAWIHQSYRLNFHSAFAMSDEQHDFVFLNTQQKNKSKFWGIGFRFGSENNFFVTKNFSIFANLAFSMLQGEFNVKQKSSGGFVLDINLDGNGTFFPKEVNFKTKFWRLRPNIDTELGLKWLNFFCNDKCQFEALLSYNFNYWFNQNEFRNTVFIYDSLDNDYQTTYSNQGNLQYQGIKVQFGFGF